MVCNSHDARVPEAGFKKKPARPTTTKCVWRGMLLLYRRSVKPTLLVLLLRLGSWNWSVPTASYAWRLLLLRPLQRAPWKRLCGY